MEVVFVHVITRTLPTRIVPSRPPVGFGPSTKHVLLINNLLFTSCPLHWYLTRPSLSSGRGRPEPRPAETARYLITEQQREYYSKWTDESVQQKLELFGSTRSGLELESTNDRRAYRMARSSNFGSQLVPSGFDIP